MARPKVSPSEPKPTQTEIESAMEAEARPVNDLSLSSKLAKSWLKSSFQAFLWVLSIAISVIIGSKINSVLDEAKPRIDLAAIDLAGSANPQTFVTMARENQEKLFGQWIFDADLQKMAQGNTVQISYLDKILANIKDQSKSFRVASDCVEELIKLTGQFQFQNQEKKQRRQQLLNIWGKNPEALRILESVALWRVIKQDFASKIMKGLDNTGYVNDASPVDTETLELPYGQRYYLTKWEPYFPPNPFPIADYVIREQTLQNNLLRSIWIVMDGGILESLFKEILLKLPKLEQESMEQTSIFSTIKEKENPEQIHCSAIITNHGTKNLIVRPIAYLKMLGDSKIPPIRLIVPSYYRVSNTSPIVIEGGKSAGIEFFSEKSVKELDVELTNSKLPLITDLYKSQIVECVVYLGRSRDGLEDEAIKSTQTQFGKRASEELEKPLLNASSNPTKDTNLKD